VPHVSRRAVFPLRLTFERTAALLISLSAITPVLADGGRGGAAVVGFAGGADSVTGSGGDGSAGSNETTTYPNGVPIDIPGGGGGGGAGVTGGAGGDGIAGSPPVGGAGGASAGAAGADGEGAPTGGTGGGGGGGGAHGAVVTASGALSAPNGGNGGKGGDGPTGVSGGGGGGGGAGGYGAVVTTGGLLLTTGASVAGGNGGRGGDASSGNIGSGGDGGSGGIGIDFVVGGSALTNTLTISGGDGGAGGATHSGIMGLTTQSGSGGAGGTAVLGSAITITNTGTIIGGNGGAAGANSVYTAAGSNGAAGAGIQGSDLTVVNSGTISGGLAGDGVTRGNAISFTGGVNTLQLQAGSNIVGDVVAYSTADKLMLGGVTNASFDLASIDMQYRGFGSFVKTGSGAWTVTGIDSATAAWTVAGGTLTVDGSIAAANLTTVESGAVLSGSGTVGTTQIKAGGTFAPGNGTAGSSMTVTGNLAFQSGAIYLVQIDPATSSTAVVSGTATLGGATVQAAFASGGYIEKRYTILTASSGISGSFASTVVTANLPHGFKTSLSYDAENTYLDLALGFADPSGPGSGSGSGFVAPSGLNGNQQAVGNALVTYFNTNGRIPAIYGSLTTSDLTQASGMHSTASQQTSFDAMWQFATMLIDPTAVGRGGSTGAPMAGTSNAYATEQTSRGNLRDAFAAFDKAPSVSFSQRWTVWASGFGGTQSTDGNAAAGSNNTTSRIYGTAVGADYRFSPDTVAGFALAGGGTSFDVGSLGSGRTDLFQAGAFIHHNLGAAYVAAALAYGWQDITTERIVTIAGIDRLLAEFNANTWSGRLEGGYRFMAPWSGGVGLTPYAAAQVTMFDLPGYAEQVLSGSNAFALAYGRQRVTDTRSELGLRADKSYVLDIALLTLRGRAAWAHDFNPDRSIAATFQALPGASFVTNGAAQAEDSALATASAELQWRSGWSTAATFEGEFSNVTRSYAGKGTIRRAW
jgi:uncharacterized protein with beta-barrel porin domain